MITDKELYEKLREEKLYSDIIYDEACELSPNIIVLHISWGDWKHDHLRLDYFMDQLGFTCLKRETTEENGSDCYSAKHIYFYRGE